MAQFCVEEAALELLEGEELRRQLARHGHEHVDLNEPDGLAVAQEEARRAARDLVQGRLS